MSTTVKECIAYAEAHRERLSAALEQKNGKDILYYRGKYLYYLKQLHKMQPDAYLDKNVTGRSSSVSLKEEISFNLEKHQSFIQKLLKKHKSKEATSLSHIPTEIGLKFRRLSTRASQVDFSSGTAKKINVVTDSLGLTKSIVKAPVMASAKILSKIGPLAVTVFAFPFTLIASAVSLTLDATDKDKKPGTYDNTVVHQMSDTLKEGVKSICETMYKNLGKL